MFCNDDLIHRSSRAQALADGVLIEVSALARQAGIHYPVALIRAAWERCVAVPPSVACQDKAGRLWDVLWLLALVARGGGGAEGGFGVHVTGALRHPEANSPLPARPVATQACRHIGWPSPPGEGGPANDGRGRRSAKGLFRCSAHCLKR
jgi:hypothetical protein